MIAPTVVVAGVVVALWASIVGRVWLTLSATLVACLAGSWGYVTTSGEPLIVSIPAALLLQQGQRWLAAGLIEELAPQHRTDDRPAGFVARLFPVQPAAGFGD